MNAFPVLSVFFGFLHLRQEHRTKLPVHDFQDFSRFLGRSLSSCDENKIVSFIREQTEIVVENPESFSYNTSCAVTRNRISYFLTRNDTTAVSPTLILPEIADECVIYTGLAFLEQEFEFAVVLDTEKPSGIFSHRFLVC